jgi:hypothetical protein
MGEGPTPDIDLQFQQKINEVVSAVMRLEMPENEKRHLVNQLEASYGGRVQYLVQLAHYLRRANTEEQGWGFLAIWRWSHTTVDEQRSALLSCLAMATADERKPLHRVLATVDARESTTGDFRAYKPYLADDRSVPALTAIRYMYQSSPREAIATMVDAKSIKKPQAIEILGRVASVQREIQAFESATTLGDKASIVPKIKEDLRELMKNPEWWVRLYVARILAKDRSYREQDIVDQLRRSSHPLIKETVEEIVKPVKNH